MAADEEGMLGVQTPRGVSLKKAEFPDSGSNESVDQPSPVSVLDNFHFEEELTPSPRAGKTSVLSLQGSYQVSEKLYIKLQLYKSNFVTFEGKLS